MITVNGDALEWQDGMSVQDMLDARNFIFPLIVVKVNGVLVRKPAYSTHILNDGDEVQVIHLISGG